MSWTDERIERLKAMWAEGKTASAIADDLGGVSRNAVIGKAHRLGLDSRPSPVKPGEDKGASAPAAAPAPSVAPASERAAPSRVKEKPAIAAILESAAPMPDDDLPAAPAAAPAPAPSTPAPAKTGETVMVYRSIGPGGFVRQGPGDQQPPIPPAPPRRLMPAKPAPEMADKTGLLDLNDRICKWPMGHPGEPDFHFCGQQANPGYPYCVQHCGVAYQAQLPRRDRRPPPPLPYGGPRVR
ncbi:GcrA family cell cycle regulator [Sphingomonas glaciei]|uniref:GcrA family cell cycle regulator n=1 Tax=Sphingomonas glaciei TaxID=2938948 RepID=A0ABY5N3Y8_9SPHN|nr:GcrA family cell cycle regulator [Sphingomonas glaciei]UUR09271.1 GcrA family cell cycle regulator [Sphingomonas glaciei]